MPTINYKSRYKINGELVMSPEELLALYFYGISIRSKDGSYIPNETIMQQIKSAQQEVEKFLEVRLTVKMITESLSYYMDDYWDRFPIMRTALPVRKPLALTGRLNNIEQIIYPQEWLNSKRDSESKFFKQISIVPTGSSATRSGIDILLTGITAYLGLTRYPSIPFYFDTQYVTGFTYKDVPYDLLDLTGKLAAIKLFHIAGDLILGAGIASISLGIDGLSQSVSATSSATNAGYGARITGYLKDIDMTFKRLKSFYKGFNLGAL